MTEAALDPSLVLAWLEARSIARALPAPVPDHGGYRVDTNSDTEVARWVFPQVGPGLVELARTIRTPRHFLKVCAGEEEMRAVLPEGWQLHEPRHFMISDAPSKERSVPEGYSVEAERKDGVCEVRIISPTGELAAGGYAAETDRAFIYDRIVTAPEHRRRGLGATVMGALGRMKRNPSTPGLLVATEDGRALYEALGWRTLSPYSTASIAEAE